MIESMYVHVREMSTWHSVWSHHDALPLAYWILGSCIHVSGLLGQEFEP